MFTISRLRLVLVLLTTTLGTFFSVSSLTVGSHSSFVYDLYDVYNPGNHAKSNYVGERFRRSLSKRSPDSTEVAITEAPKIKHENSSTSSPEINEPSTPWPDMQKLNAPEVNKSNTNHENTSILSPVSLEQNVTHSNMTGRFLSGFYGSLKSGVGSVMSYFYGGREEPDEEEQNVIVTMLGISDQMKDIDPDEKKVLVKLLTNATQLEMEKHTNGTSVPNREDLFQNIAKKAEEEGAPLLSENSKKILAELGNKAWKEGTKAVNVLAKLSKNVLRKGAKVLSAKASELLSALVSEADSQDNLVEPTLIVALVTSAPLKTSVEATSTSLTTVPTTTQIPTVQYTTQIPIVQIVTTNLPNLQTVAPQSTNNPTIPSTASPMLRPSDSFQVPSSTVSSVTSVQIPSTIPYPNVPEIKTTVKPSIPAVPQQVIPYALPPESHSTKPLTSVQSSLPYALPPGYPSMSTAPKVTSLVKPVPNNLPPGYPPPAAPTAQTSLPNALPPGYPSVSTDKSLQAVPNALPPGYPPASPKVSSVQPQPSYALPPGYPPQSPVRPNAGQQTVVSPMPPAPMTNVKIGPPPSIYPSPPPGVQRVAAQTNPSPQQTLPGISPPAAPYSYQPVPQANAPYAYPQQGQSYPQPQPQYGYAPNNLQNPYSFNQFSGYGPMYNRGSGIQRFGLTG